MIQEKNNVYGEVFAILSFLNVDLIDKIPDNVIKRIGNLSTNSNTNFYVNKEKKLNAQDISEESKDLISLIYYTYIANENEKNELLKLWNKNENKYQEKLRKEYNLDNLFQHRSKELPTSENVLSSNTSMVEYKKETLFSKIQKFIKKILKRG